LMRRPPMLKFSGRTRAAALVGALLLIATACGSSASDGQGDGDRIASLSEDLTEATTAAAETSNDEIAGDVSGDDLEAPDDPEDAFALFNECMEDQGLPGAIAVSVGDSGNSSGINVSEVADSFDEIDPQAGGSFEDFDADAFNEANEACEGHLANIDGGFDLTPEQQTAMEDAQLEFSDCMAEQGVEVPEFDGDSGGIVIGAVIETDSSGADPQSGDISHDDLDFDFEAFNEAAEACQHVFDQFEALDS
jgi:hypothetical protein